MLLILGPLRAYLLTRSCLGSIIKSHVFITEQVFIYERPRQELNKKKLESPELDPRDLLINPAISAATIKAHPSPDDKSSYYEFQNFVK